MALLDFSHDVQPETPSPGSGHLSCQKHHQVSSSAPSALRCGYSTGRDALSLLPRHSLSAEVLSLFLRLFSSCEQHALTKGRYGSRRRLQLFTCFGS